MKVSIERSALLKAMSQAQSVVERRNTIPILANVLIEAEGGEISFRATDLDIEVVYKVVGMVERAGATTVGAHTLHEIVRKLPDGAMVELTDDATANRLDVVAGRSSFSLATLPREDFPIMANSEYACNFSAQAETLRRLFDKSKFAISTEETRYYLNGVYMHSSDGENGRVLQESQARYNSTVEVSPGVLEFMAQRISSNVRVLEGALTRLYAFGSLVGRPVTLEMAQESLSDILRATDRKVTIDEIIRKVTDHYGVNLTDMLSARRTRSIARPRQVAMYLSKKLTSKSLPEIGRRFGKRDHTTVIHAVKKIEELQSIDNQIAKDIEILRRMLEG